MSVQIPEPLHALLVEKAGLSGSSVEALVVSAVEQTYGSTENLEQPVRGDYVTGPLITCNGSLGPDFPVDENPHDLMFFLT